MSQRRVKSRVANSGYSVSGSGRAIGYARWEVASLAQQFTTMVTTIIAIIVTAGGATAAGSAAGDGIATRSP
jgi:hypothetical protein